MLVNICMKFHESTLNGFWVTERTRPYRKIYYFQFQRAITPKIRNPELRFLRSARRLMLLYICVTFHENISKGFLVTERTRFCDRQTDGRTDDQGKKNMSSNPTGGDIKRSGAKLFMSQTFGVWVESLVHTNIMHDYFFFLFLYLEQCPYSDKFKMLKNDDFFSNGYHSYMYEGLPWWGLSISD